MVTYCDECHRLKDIACVCHIPFKERVKSINTQWASWSDTRDSNG